MDFGLLVMILSAVFALLLVWMFFAKSYLGEAGKRVNDEWEAMVNGLKKRHDLVPNLIETLRAHTDKQEEIVQELIQVRAKAMRLNFADAYKVEVEYELSKLINRVIDFGRTMQEMSLQTNFLELRKEIADLESNVETHSDHYNEIVRAFNDLLARTWFKPWGKLFGYKPKNIFEIEI